MSSIIESLKKLSSEINEEKQDDDFTTKLGWWFIGIVVGVLVLVMLLAKIQFGA